MTREDIPFFGVICLWKCDHKVKVGIHLFVVGFFFFFFFFAMKETAEQQEGWYHVTEFFADL